MSAPSVDLCCHKRDRRVLGKLQGIPPSQFPELDLSLSFLSPCKLDHLSLKSENYKSG